VNVIVCDIEQFTQQQEMNVYRMSLQLVNTFPRLY